MNTAAQLTKSLARWSYLQLFGSGGVVDQGRYIYYNLIHAGWCPTQIGSETFEFRCSTVAETRRAAVALRREREIIEQLCSICEPGMTVFDIGANVGTHALPIAAAIGNSGVTVCFEPHPETFNGLVANVKRNRAENVWTEQFALGATTGTTELFIEHDESGVGSHSLRQRNPQFEKTEYVEVATGDGYVSTNDIVPDLMKIDVEGGEMDVLSGFSSTLAEHHPVLSIEIHDNVLHQEVQNELEAYGYSISKMMQQKDIILAK